MYKEKKETQKVRGGRMGTVRWNSNGGSFQTPQTMPRFKQLTLPFDFIGVQTSETGGPVNSHVPSPAPSSSEQEGTAEGSGEEWVVAENAKEWLGVEECPESESSEEGPAGSSALAGVEVRRSGVEGPRRTRVLPAPRVRRSMRLARAPVDKEAAELREARGTEDQAIGLVKIELKKRQEWARNRFPYPEEHEDYACR